MSDPATFPTFNTPASIAVVESDDDHVVLTHANVLIVVWSGRQEPESCRRLYDTAIRLAERAGTGKVAAISIIQPGTTAPTAKAREALGRLIEDKEGVIFRSALVHPNDGFLASIIRSVALGLMQRSSRRQGHQVFQRVYEAIRWVTEGLPTSSGQPIAAASLNRALEAHLAPPRSRVA